MDNDWSRFDGTAPAQAAVPATASTASSQQAPAPVTGVVPNIGAGAQEGGAGIINAASDPVGYLYKTALLLGAGAYNYGARTIGYGPISPQMMRLLADDGPGPGDRLVGALDRVGGVPTPDQVVPATDAQRYARAAAQGAAGLGALAETLPAAAAQAGLGALSGVGSQAASDAAPDDLKPVAGLLGGVLFPGAAAGAAAGARAIARPVVNGLLDYAAPALGKPSVVLDAAGTPVAGKRCTEALICAC